MLEIKKIEKNYKYIKALNVNDLLFEENKIYGLVGHNGAGKTTLFKCITNVINNYHGEVLLDGLNIRENASVLTKVGLVLDGMNIYTNRTGWFNIKYFSGLRGIHNEQLVNELAKELDITNVLDKKVSTYSYGMKKKLILLIALINEPKLLILDEPFRGLDIKTVEFFKEYLRTLQAKGLTLIISSHVLSDLEDLCDNVIVLDRGVLDKKINIKELKNQEWRTLNTSNNAKVEEIFKENNVSYEIVNGLLKYRLTDEGWKKIFQTIVLEDIEIVEMNKIDVLKDEILKKGGN